MTFAAPVPPGPFLFAEFGVSLGYQLSSFYGRMPPTAGYSPVTDSGMVSEEVFLKRNQYSSEKRRKEVEKKKKKEEKKLRKLQRGQEGENLEETAATPEPDGAEGPSAAE